MSCSVSRITKSLFFSLAGTLAIFTVGCVQSAKIEEAGTSQPADQAKPVVETSSQAQFVAHENKSNFVSEITFAKNKSTLSSAAQKSLATELEKAAKSQTLEEVKIIAWSDMEYPSVHTQKLSKAQRDLAENRTSNIEKFLKTKGLSAKVEQINMAERPNALERFFNSEDARIKKSLEIAGVPNTDTAVKSPSKAAKAIVVFIPKE